MKRVILRERESLKIYGLENNKFLFYIKILIRFCFFYGKKCVAAANRLCKQNKLILSINENLKYQNLKSTFNQIQNKNKNIYN